MLECVTEADSWAQDEQNKIAMVWLIWAMGKVLYSGDTHREKCPKIIFKNWNYHIKESKSLTAWLMWSNYEVIEYEVVNQLKLEAVT